MDTGPIKSFFWAILYPINYLFYKLYIFFSYMTLSEVPMSNLSFMGALFIVNAITIYEGFWEVMPPIWLFVLIFLFLLPYGNPKVADKIIARYENESEDSKIIGNIVVIAYIIASIVLLIKVS